MHFGMYGPYTLTADEIDRVLTHKQCGNYLLGKSVGGGPLVEYAGRDDVDVAQRLKQHASNNEAPIFWANYATNPVAAFHTESWHYHTIVGLKNLIHPARPAGHKGDCPHCPKKRP